MNLLNRSIKYRLCSEYFKLCLSFTFALLVSCSSAPPNPQTTIEPVLSTGSDVIFDCFSINHAWGYQLSGFFIDNIGRVYRYKRQGSPWRPKPIRKGNQRFYEKSDLLNKFSDKSLAARVDNTILQSKIRSIDFADAGSVAHTKHKVADAGQNLCLAYRYEPGNIVYRPIALGSFGVTEKSLKNTSTAAQSLLNWLIDVVAKQIEH